MTHRFDLNLLPPLDRLLATRSVTRAAQQAGTSQPSMSRALARLRDAFDDPLLQRTNGGMAVTARADALRAPLARWMTATRALMRTPEGHTPERFGGTFRIASTDYGILTMLSDAIGAISAAAPRLSIEIVALTDRSAADLADGSVDIMITGFPPEPVRSCERKLFDESFRCLVRRDHPAALRSRDGDSYRAMTIDEFTACPHIVMKVNELDGDFVSRRLADIGRSRRVAVRLPYFSTAPHLLHGSDALLVMPTRAARLFADACGLAAIPAPIELGTFGYWLVWHERSQRDPATLWLIDCLADAARR